MLAKVLTCAVVGLQGELVQITNQPTSLWSVSPSTGRTALASGSRYVPSAWAAGPGTTGQG